VYNGNTAALTDATSGALITPTSSGNSSQIVILWGTPSRRSFGPSPLGPTYYDNRTLNLILQLLTLILLGHKVGRYVIERRKNQRFELRLPLEIIGAGAKPKTIGETKNLSSSGVLFTAAAPVQVGESIEYFITFPKAPGTHTEVRLRCLGTVLRGEQQLAFAATLERYEFVRK
jgi:hypothetical protein